MAKILNSWLQRAVIFLRKRFPESPWFWRILRFETGQKIYTWVKRSTTRIVSFCSRKKRLFLQVLYSICILDANDVVLTMCDLTQIVGCYRVLLLERQREILWDRKRMLYRAVAWPPKMRARMYQQLFDFTCCLRNPWVIVWGEGEGINWLIYIRTPWSSFVPRKTSLVVSTKKKKRIRKELNALK